MFPVLDDGPESELAVTEPIVLEPGAEFIGDDELPCLYRVGDGEVEVTFILELAPVQDPDPDILEDGVVPCLTEEVVAIGGEAKDFVTFFLKLSLFEILLGRALTPSTAELSSTVFAPKC